MIVEIILFIICLGLVLFGLWLTFGNKLRKSSKYYEMGYTCGNCKTEQTLNIPIKIPLKKYLKENEVICKNCFCKNELTVDACSNIHSIGTYY